MHKQELHSGPLGAAYIRVSTDEQTELSPDAQLREIIKAARADGVEIPGEYIFMEERGRSGRRADNRPEFQRMIATARQKPAPFQYLYLWKFSRFARNQEESTFYKGILRKKCGITIKSVSEPIMEGMFGRLVEMIIEWSDEFYSINLSGEVLRGMTEKAMRQGYQSTPCLGYNAIGDGKPFVINEEQYKAVVFIHQAFHQGRDLAAIAREANARGYRTRRGNLFTARAVRGILSNRFYAGEVVWNDITFKGAHETRPEITAVFPANQERLAQTTAGRREVSSCRHWLSGLLVCSECGASLGYSRSKDPGKRPDCFQCWKYTKGLHQGSCCISTAKAEAAVIRSLEAMAGPNLRSYCLKTEPGINQEQFLRTALAKLHKKEQRIRDAYENGIDSLDEYRENRRRLQVEQDYLLSKCTPPADSQNQTGRLLTVCGLLTDPEIDYEIKGNALRQVLRKIVFDRKANVMHFHYYL